MTSNRTNLCFASLLSAALASGAVGAWAAEASTPGAARPAPTTLAQADRPVTTMGEPSGAPTAPGFNPMERGVRKAAAGGPTTLRRYVQRTEAIYHFSYWDFAKLLPRE